MSIENDTKEALIFALLGLAELLDRANSADPDFELYRKVLSMLYDKDWTLALGTIETMRKSLQLELDGYTRVKPSK